MVLYSVVVMATIIPGFPHIPTPILILYYFVVPGYFVTLLLRETSTILDRVFYTIAWSLAIVATVYAIEQIAYPDLPTNLAVPAFTVVLLAYDHFHSR